MGDRDTDILRLCQMALERPPEQRPRFVAAACDGDEALRREVESLLAQDTAADRFLETSALQVAVRQLQDGTAGRHATLAAGSRFGPYEVRDVVGAGGMGEVYRARDHVLHRDVALKVLPDVFALDGDRLARFQREAQMLASLNHPNIGTIHGIEESGHVRALVLELVEGPTLADRIARGEMPLDDVLPIARQIIEALEAAHARGIVHRDLKPANINVRPDGVVKVLDFGLAKLLHNGPSVVPDLTHSSMLDAAGTSPGVILGTVGYMSPEQAKGDAADQRSDIFSFGCILYELLTGRRAFEGETASEILASVLKSEVDFAALPARLNPRLIDLLRRCLEKNPKQRWHAAADVRIELEGVTSRWQMVNEPHRVTGKPKGMWKRALAVTASLVIAALGAGYSVWMLKPEPPRGITRFVHSLPEGQQFTDQSGQLVALSQDGRNLVYVANQRLYLRLMSVPEARAIPGSEGNVSSPVFSPDGREVAYYSVAERALKRLNLTGGTPSTIAKIDDRPFGLSWSKQDIVYSLLRQGIFRVPAQGGIPEKLVPVSDEFASSPQMLPGGGAVLFSVRRSFEDQDQGRVVVQPLDGGVRKTLVERGLDGRYLPTGHLVYVVSGNLLAQPFDLASLSVSGKAVPIVEGIRRSTLIASPAMAQFSYSATGSMAFLPGPSLWSDANVDLALFDRQAVPKPFRLAPRRYRSPRVSPSGKSVAFDIAEANGASNVWVYELAGGKLPQRLTRDGKSRYPIWSPDGQWVTFQSGSEGDLALFRQRADGSGRRERLTTPEAGTEHVPQSWSKDDGQLLFSVFKDKVCSLGTLSMKDRKVASFGDVHSVTLAEGAFSPDGRWVAYWTQESSKAEPQVFLQRFPAGDGPFFVRNGTHVYWSSPRGDELVVNTGPGTSVVIPVIWKPDRGVGDTTTPLVTFGLEKDFPRGLRREGDRVTRLEADSMPDGEHVIGVMIGGESLLPQINVVLNWFDEVRQRVPR